MHDFSAPCPPTPLRKTQWAARGLTRQTGGVPGAVINIAAVPDIHKSEFLVSIHAINEFGEKPLLTMLTHVFGGFEAADDALEESEGKGRLFITKLTEVYDAADPADKALVGYIFR